MSEIYRASNGEKSGEYEVYRHIPVHADQRYVAKKERTKGEDDKFHERWVVKNKASGEEISDKSPIFKRVMQAITEHDKRQGNG